MKNKHSYILSLAIFFSILILMGCIGFAVWRYQASRQPVMQIMPGNQPPFMGGY